MIDKTIKWIFAADFHLGHSKVKAKILTENIIKYLFPEFKNTYAIFLTGDIFDQSVSMNSEDSPNIISFFIDLFLHAFQHNLKVRILQGTFSHDRHQLLLVKRLFHKLKLDMDFKYVKTVSIEFIEKIGWVLYLPDNLPFTNKRSLFEHIDTLMIANDIKELDLVVFHGEFEHACNNFGDHKSYTLDDFKKILKKDGKIIGGHIHTASCLNNRFAYSGSFDRLAHNEESAKGFWVIENDEFRFVENKDAIKFTTHKVKRSELPDILEEISDLIDRDFPKDKIGYLRLIIKDNHMKQSIVKYINDNYPHLAITFKKKKTKDKAFEFVDHKLHGHTTEEELEVPTQKNIAPIIYNHLKDKGERLTITLADIEDVLRDAA